MKSRPGPDEETIDPKERRVWINQVSLMLNNRSYLEKLDGQALVTLMEGNRTNVHFNRNVPPLQTCLKNPKRRVTYIQ